MDPSPSGPLPEGTEHFPNTAGGDLSLCYDDDFRECMHADDIAITACLSNRGKKGAWSGFANDNVDSYALTGQKAMKCNFYREADCQGRPLFSDSSESGPVYVNNISKMKGQQYHDVISSFICGDPTVRTSSDGVAVALDFG